MCCIWKLKFFPQTSSKPYLLLITAANPFIVGHRQAVPGPLSNTELKTQQAHQCLFLTALCLSLWFLCTQEQQRVSAVLVPYSLPGFLLSVPCR